MAADKGRLGGSNRVLNQHEAAEFLNLSYKYFNRIYKAEGIKYFKQGRCIYFRERYLIEYIEKREAA